MYTFYVSVNSSSNTNQGSISNQYFREKMEEIEQAFANIMCSIIFEGNVLNNNLSLQKATYHVLLGL